VCYNGGVMKEDGTCQCDPRFVGKRCKQSKWRHYLFSVYILIRPHRTPVLLQMFIFRPGRQFRMDLCFYSWCFFSTFSFFSISISLIIFIIIIIIIFLCFFCVFLFFSPFLFIYFVTRTQNYLGRSPWSFARCSVSAIWMRFIIRHHLRSVRRGQLDVPRCQLTIYGVRSFVLLLRETVCLIHSKTLLCHYLLFRNTLRYFFATVTNTMNASEVVRRRCAI